MAPRRRIRSCSRYVKRFQIPSSPFLNLLLAFEQDQRVQEYATFTEVLAYCVHSANPVGRLVLYVFECFDDERAILSDEVCTGLQLANFWQDVARDAAMGRRYLPREDCERFGYAGEPRATAAFRELLRFEVERTRGYFARGRVLLPLLPRRAKVDVSLFIAGGEAILDAIVRQDFDVWTTRPTVTKSQKLRLLLRSILTP
jgi:squalene synthase HpnC